MKVLILSCNTGQGHNSAALAVAEQLSARGVGYEIRDTLAFASERISREVSTVYAGLARHTPRLIGAAYRVADRRGGRMLQVDRKTWFYRLNSLLAPSMYAWLSANGTPFDAVLMTHICAGEVVTAMRRRYGWRVPSFLLSTDYDFCPFSEELDVDRYLIPHEDLLPRFASLGVPPARTLVTGIPVSGHFAAHMTRGEARARLGLPSADTTRLMLVMTGSMGYGATEQLVAELLVRTPEDVGVVVMGGHNGELKARLRARYARQPAHRVFVLDFCSSVPLYFDACDLLLTKPGGLSSTEAAVHGIPMIHTQPIPGWESSNRSFFAGHGMALAAADTRDAAGLAIKLLNDLPAQARMRQAQARNMRAGAAGAVCDVLMGETQKR